MSDIAIRVEGIGKKYRIGKKKSGEFRESFGNLIQLFKSKASSQQPAANSTFWALKDISFEVKKGEAVGIIGRNGAGKSTLLKVLSRITRPTTGRFEINGRVSSLLEVGTGFHPELTGRENIYLNGTILGMRRAEIKAKFDEIIAFSGVEEFIDTPVKHYSSGMKVRLAFSVAAHLEPEILIIDEVLAVGDAEFQKKCLGKMEDVTGKGRTVLFVSHNMGAVRQLCNNGLVLEKGKVRFVGEAQESVSFYLGMDQTNLSENIWTKQEVNEKVPIELVYADLQLSGDQPNMILQVLIKLRSNFTHQSCFIAFDVLTEEYNPILQAIPTEEGFIKYLNKEQAIKTRIILPPLIPGKYKLSIWVGPHYTETYDWQKEILAFEIQDSPISSRTHPHSKNHGYIIPNSEIYFK